MFVAHLDPVFTAGVIFVLTYVVLGFGALPPLRIDRTGAALVGATAMLAFGVLTPAEALASVDFHTLALLFGMMIVVAHLRLSGFFRWLGEKILGRPYAPPTLLAIVVGLSGLLAALFVNDTACVLLTPVVLGAARSSGRRAAPYLLGVAMGANAGSVATIVGNPQNMLVASVSRISYARFLTVLGPVGGFALLAAWLLLWFLCRRELALVSPGRPAGVLHVHVHRPLLVKSLVVTALLLAAMLAGAEAGIAALGGAAVLLVTRRVKPRKVYAQVDWSLLAMFTGLFVVIGGVERAGLAAKAMELLTPTHSIGVLIAATAALSNLVSNVPAVLLLKSWAIRIGAPERVWLAIAMSSTLAGNFTIVGSVANLIVVEQARGSDRIGFWTYARVGIPLALISLVAGAFWLEAVAR